MHIYHTHTHICDVYMMQTNKQAFQITINAEWHPRGWEHRTYAPLRLVSLKSESLAVWSPTWEPKNPTESLAGDGSMETHRLWAASFGNHQIERGVLKGKSFSPLLPWPPLLAQSPSVLWLQLHWYQNQHLKLSPWTRGHWLCRNFPGFWGHIATTKVPCLVDWVTTKAVICPSKRDRYSGLL